MIGQEYGAESVRYDAGIWGRSRAGSVIAGDSYRWIGMPEGSSLELRSETYDAQVLAGATAIKAATLDLERLRRASGQTEDVLVSTSVFLLNSLRWRSRPVAVLLRRSGVLFGAAFFHERTVMGMPTGILRAGHRCGRGSAVGPARLHARIIELAATHLCSRSNAHTVVARLYQSPSDQDFTGVAPQQWRSREERSAIDLDGGWDAVCSRLSYKMRRNVSYYRRKAEKDLGCVFVPDLTWQQSATAIAALSGATRQGPVVRRTRQYVTALRDLPHAAAMGLMDGGGRWLSYLTGWRVGQRLYVECQLNLDALPKASISTVMRSFCLWHEARAGTREIVFTGGTNDFWSRACSPGRCCDLLMSRGLHGYATLALSRRFRPQGDLADLSRDLHR